ncbi:hypothetical protein F4778DRAFT_784550 [Xylariomycetidae sp. FL2044]|nr:hypothetical protein F4778DRAFT_784550 [Xylariomycetidae sp. FL2044]
MADKEIQSILFDRRYCHYNPSATTPQRFEVNLKVILTAYLFFQDFSKGIPDFWPSLGQLLCWRWILAGAAKRDFTTPYISEAGSTEPCKHKHLGCRFVVRDAEIGPFDGSRKRHLSPRDNAGPTTGPSKSGRTTSNGAERPERIFILIPQNQRDARIEELWKKLDYQGRPKDGNGFTINVKVTNEYGGGRGHAITFAFYPLSKPWRRSEGPTRRRGRCSTASGSEAQYVDSAVLLTGPSDIKDCEESWQECFCKSREGEEKPPQIGLETNERQHASGLWVSQAEDDRGAALRAALRREKGDPITRPKRLAETFGPSIVEGVEASRADVVEGLLDSLDCYRRAPDGTWAKSSELGMITTTRVTAPPPQV